MSAPRFRLGDVVLAADYSAKPGTIVEVGPDERGFRVDRGPTYKDYWHRWNEMTLLRRHVEIGDSIRVRDGYDKGSLRWIVRGQALPATSPITVVELDRKCAGIHGIMADAIEHADGTPIEWPRIGLGTTEAARERQELERRETQQAIQARGQFAQAGCIEVAKQDYYRAQQQFANASQGQCGLQGTQREYSALEIQGEAGVIRIKSAAPEPCIDHVPGEAFVAMKRRAELAERRANELSDECGQLRTELDAFLLKNAKLERELERLTAARKNK